MMSGRLHAIEQAPCRFEAYDGRDTIDAHAIAGFRARGNVEVAKHNTEK